MFRVIAYRIYNQRGANTTIDVWVQHGTGNKGYRIPYGTSEMSHFCAACTMLQNKNVAFDPNSKRFETFHSFNQNIDQSTLENDFEPEVLS